MMPPFIIYGLPRSRTFWLSRYLSYGDWHCGHDEVRHARSLDDIRAWFKQPCTGTVETAAAPFWRLVRDRFPEVQTVTVRRPVEEVIESLAAIGLIFDRDAMMKTLVRLNGKLDQIERRVPNVLSVRFHDLEDEGCCREIFEHCLPYRYDHQWWALLASVNLQTNMTALIRYMIAYQESHAKLAEVVKRATITDMRPRKFITRDDVTIQQESCDVWFRDGKRLFEEHAIQLGEGPDGYLKKNWKLMETMDRLGCMQIMTARCNGRMVGYYVCYVAPATDDAELLSALHISIFISKDFAGLGTRLQRASIEMLRQKGVGEICFRSGVKADGARMAAIYKRSGAEYIGEMYRLPLKAA